MRILCQVVFLILAKAGFCLNTHPVSISWIQGDLQDDRVLLNIKIFAEDLIYFHNLSPDTNRKLDADLLIKSAQKHIEVLKEAIVILDENDHRTEGQFIKSNFNALEKSSYYVTDLNGVSLHYQFEFQLSEDSEFLTFTQNLDAVPSISFLSISKNGNELVNQRELRSNKPFTIKRDATSIGSVEQQDFMLSYFSLSDTKVTHEITLPIRLLQSFVQVKSVGNLKTLEKFITENSSVEVDNVTLEPEIESFTLMNENGNKRESIVNVRIVYSLTEIPDNIALEWSHFNWKMRWFESVIDAFGEEKKHKFSRFKTRIEMERKLEILEKN